MKYVSSVQTVWPSGLLLTDRVAFWTVVTKDRTASIFWDRAKDEGSTFQL
jgi:hypothetical protein